MPSSTEFFTNPTTGKALTELAAADSITVIVGAGVGVESALPSWAELVRALLGRAAGSVMARPSDEDRKTFADWALTVDGVIGGAELARALGQSNNDIANALYKRSGPKPVPGPSARALAQLAALRGRLVTTNYDTTLEQAIGEPVPAGIARSARAVADASPAPDDEIVVRHLHGVLSPTGRATGTLVLSESDYAAMGQDAWQAEVVRDALDSGPCLFVGTSMSDPNLLRYLHRANGPTPHQHYALLARQGDPFLSSNTPDALIESARTDATLRRWRRVNVEPLQPPWFADSAQFLFELVSRRSGAPLGDYSRRLNEWHDALVRTVMPQSPVAAFRKRQEWLHDRLAQALDLVREELSTFTRVADERFILSLWAYEPGEKLLAVANSDRVHRDPDTLDPVPIESGKEWTSVQAFRRGTPLSDDTSMHAVSRWNTVLGVPVSIDNETYGRLQVGVMTLAGSEVPANSALEQVGPETLRNIRLILEDVGAALLTPAPEK